MKRPSISWEANSEGAHSKVSDQLEYLLHPARDDRPPKQQIRLNITVNIYQYSQDSSWTNTSSLRDHIESATQTDKPWNRLQRLISPN